MWCFCRCQNSIWRKFTAAVQPSAGPSARHPAPLPPPSLLLGWRNMRCVLLRPILFCIFGMCSPWRKSAATVRTVCRYSAHQKMIKSLLCGAVLDRCFYCTYFDKLISFKVYFFSTMFSLTSIILYISYTTVFQYFYHG